MSNTNDPHESELIPVDQAVGDDADAEGIAQPISSDEIADLVNMGDLSEGERAARLREMRSELMARRNMDRASEFDGLIGEIDDALAALDPSAAPEGLRTDLAPPARVDDDGGSRGV